MIDDFESKVEQQIQRLKHQATPSIEAEVARKRIAWVEENYHAGEHAGLSPRAAFEWLFFNYMGLRVSDLLVLSESATDIVWLSRNPCPTLAAARKLGLDTRALCRAVYEKSTQAFLSQIDPQLRFLRSYDEIRPYADHCKEMIVRVDFEAMLRLAIDEAEASKADGHMGDGAVVVLGHQILARAHATPGAACDPGLHAEVNAIQQALQVLGDSNLSGAILFSTSEPCPVCADWAVSANLTTIVYGVSADDIARLGQSQSRIGSRAIAAKSPVIVDVIGGRHVQRWAGFSHAQAHPARRPGQADR